MDVRFGVFKTRKAMRTNVVRKNHHLTPGSGICGYTTGIPKSHRVIWIYDLENARPSIFWRFFVGIKQRNKYEQNIRYYTCV